MTEDELQEHEARSSQYCIRARTNVSSLVAEVKRLQNALRDANRETETYAKEVGYLEELLKNERRP